MTATLFSHHMPEMSSSGGWKTRITHRTRLRPLILRYLSSQTLVTRARAASAMAFDRGDTGSQ